MTRELNKRIIYNKMKIIISLIIMMMMMMTIMMIIIIKVIFIPPSYHTRWEPRALYNNPIIQRPALFYLELYSQAMKSRDVQ